MRSPLAVGARTCAALLLAALVLSACAGATRLYTGPERPLAEVVVLETQYPREIDIFGIDGARVYGSAWHIEPGRHEIWVKITARESMGAGITTDFIMTNACVFELDMEAGTVYRIEPDIQVEGGGIQKAVTSGAKIRDSTGRSGGPRDCPGYVPELEN